jgi:hypothetical protein
MADTFYVGQWIWWKTDPNESEAGLIRHRRVEGLTGPFVIRSVVEPTLWNALCVTISEVGKTELVSVAYGPDGHKPSEYAVSWFRTTPPP